MARIIYDSGIGDFLADVAREMTLYVPVFTSRNYPDQIGFQKWSPDCRLALKYAVTILPPKEFLMPDGEVLFNFENDVATAPKLEAQTIFGLSLEDLEGLHKLAEIMKKSVSDVPFETRRATTFLVGLDKYSPPTHLDFDIYLQEFEPGVYVGTAKTKQGKKWLAGQHFRAHTINGTTKLTKKNDPLLSDPLLPRAIKDSAAHPIWEELTETCFGCGICSYVCPLCYCFETEDSIEFGKSECGERCRNWDSCMLKNFTATNNHNFRPELKDRIYNWYYHKFYRMPREQGFNGCVDCNRCTVYCPAKINYRRVLTRVLADYKKRPQK